MSENARRMSAADVADEIFERACAAEYNQSTARGQDSTAGPTRRGKGRGRRDRARRLLRKQVKDGSNDVEHRGLGMRSRRPILRRAYRRLQRRLLGKKQAGNAEGEPTNTRAFRQARTLPSIDENDEIHLNPFSEHHDSERVRSPRSGHFTRSTTTKFTRPVPGPIGFVKLKDHDGPDVPQIKVLLNQADTHFPDLRPTVLKSDKTITIHLSDNDKLETTPTQFQLHGKLMRELVTWYSYSRRTSPVLMNCCRAISSAHPIKICVTASLGEQLPALQEADDDGSTLDVFAGIGTKGFTFALSNVHRRSVWASQPELRTPPTSVSRQVSHANLPADAASKKLHRLRRVSLTVDLAVAENAGVGVHAPTPEFGLVKTIATPLIKPRDRARLHRGPTKFGKSFGTSLGPWVNHDPDRCDHHDHNQYFADVAGSVRAYHLEHAIGWASHAQLSSLDLWQEVALAEGGRFEKPAIARTDPSEFGHLFDKMLGNMDTFSKDGKRRIRSKGDQHGDREADIGPASYVTAV
ncbi:hypothetical protein HDU85_000200 [Gaertneriomyces sp. JEL0708]|nr:hypothetical protein HDU85_000200 [Gaertneriomyces sp. JEL0708]